MEAMQAASPERPPVATNGRGTQRGGPPPVHHAPISLLWTVRWFAVVAAVSASVGTLLFCYRALLGPAADIAAWVHEWTGNAAMVLLALYLAAHLPRTWRLRRIRPFSWWSGIGALAGWTAAGASGVFGQFSALGGVRWVWWLHVLGSLAAVVAAAAHAAYGFRNLRKENE